MQQYKFLFYAILTRVKKRKEKGEEMQVVKRDGSIVNYDRSKIVTAINAANAEVEEIERASSAQIEEILDYIESKKRSRIAGRGRVN